MPLQFQFHKGTIKTASSLLDCVAVIPFQFHKGTIKTEGKKGKKHDTLKFQFHKGTIKTKEDTFKFRIYPNFNSIKVRLKPKKTPSSSGYTPISIP